MTGAKGKDFVGPPTWTLIHSIAANYDVSQSKGVKEFMLSLTKVFPCAVCRKNLMEKLTDKIPVDNYLGSRDDLFLWSYIIHDMVNQHINKYHPGDKKKISPPYEQVKAFYFDKFDEDCKSCRV